MPTARSPTSTVYSYWTPSQASRSRVSYLAERVADIMRRQSGETQLLREQLQAQQTSSAAIDHRSFQTEKKLREVRHHHHHHHHPASSSSCFLKKKRCLSQVVFWVSKKTCVENINWGCKNLWWL